MLDLGFFDGFALESEEDKGVVREFSISKDGTYLVELNALAGTLPYAFSIYRKGSVRDTLMLSGGSMSIRRTLKLTRGDYRLVVTPLDTEAEGECRFSFPTPELVSFNIHNFKELRVDYRDHAELYGGITELDLLKEGHVNVGGLTLGIDGAKVQASSKGKYIEFKLQTSILVKFGDAKMRLDFSSGDNALYMYSNASDASLYKYVGSKTGFDLVGECKICDWTFHGYGLKSLTVKADTRSNTYTISASVAIMRNVYVNGALSWKKGSWDSFSVGYNSSSGLHIAGGVNLVSLDMGAKGISATSNDPLTLNGNVGLAYGKTISISSNLDLIFFKVEKGKYALASLNVGGSWSTNGTISGNADLQFFVRDGKGLISAKTDVKYVPGHTLDVTAKFNVLNITVDGRLHVGNDTLTIQGSGKVNFKVFGVEFNGECGLKFVSNDIDKTFAVYKEWSAKWDQELDEKDKKSATAKVNAGIRRTTIFSFRTGSWSKPVEGDNAKEVFENLRGLRSADSIYAGTWEFDENATTGYFMVACDNVFDGASIQLGNSDGKTFDVTKLGSEGAVRIVDSSEDVYIIAADNVGGTRWTLAVTGDKGVSGEVATSVTYDKALDAFSLKVVNAASNQIEFQYAAYSKQDHLTVSLYMATDDSDTGYFVADLEETMNGSFTWVVPDDFQGMTGQFYLSVYGDSMFPIESKKTSEVTLAKHFADVSVSNVAIVHSRYDNGISLSFDLGNAALVASDSFVVSVYLSTDNEFNSSDTMLGVIQVSGLDANGLLHRTIDVAIPQDLDADATYYIGIVADMEGVLDEYNWVGNNTDSITIETNSEGIAILPPSEDVLLDGQMPRLEYMYGCTPTALAMLMGYYDLYGYRGKSFSNLIKGDVELNARGTDGDAYNMNAFDTILGRFAASPEYVYRFYSQEDLNTIVAEGPRGDYAKTTPEQELQYSFQEDGEIFDTSSWNCLADYIGTGQYWRGQENLSTAVHYDTLANIANSDMTTTIKSGDVERTIDYKYTTLLYGLQLYARSRGYSLDYEITGTYATDNNRGSFTFEEYKAEIDAGRPVLIGIEGHSMVGYGYNADTGEIIFDDDYDEDQRMLWGETYNYSGAERELQSITVIGLRTQDGERDLKFNEKPYFTIASDTASRYYCYADDELLINFSVTNDGDDETNDFQMALTVDGKLKQTVVGTSLRGSEIRQYSNISIGKLSEGAHQVEIILDSENDIEETDGGNNRSTMTVQVLPKGMTILSSSMTLASGKSASNVMIAAYGSMTLDGGNADNIFLHGSSAGYSGWYGYAYLYAKEGGLAKKVEAFEKGYIVVSSGGTVQNVVVHSGGRMTVSEGGMAANVTFSGGYGYNSGNISKLLVESGAYLENNGGTITRATVDGSLSIWGSQGGKLTSATINGSLRMTATGSAVASKIVLGSKGSAYVYSGGVIRGVSGIGELYVANGGIAKQVVLTGGRITVASKGRSEDVVLHSGTSQAVYSGGTAVRTSALDGAWINASSGAVLSNAVIGSGGSISLREGAKAYNLTVEQGGIVYAWPKGYMYKTLTIGGSVQDISGEGIAGVSSYIFNVQTQTDDAFLSLSSGGIAENATITIDVSQAWGKYTLIKGDLTSLSSATVSVQSNGSSAEIASTGTAELEDGRKVKLAKSGDSWSLTVSGTDKQAPQAPGNVTANLTDNVLNLTWDKVQDFSGVKYEVQYSRDAKFSDATSQVVNSPVIALTLNNGLWYWRVRCVDGAGNKSAWTTASKTTVDYTKTLNGTLSQTQEVYSDVILTKGTSVSAGYPGAVQVQGDGFSVTLEGNNKLTSISIRNAAILFGDDASWVNYYGYGPHYDGTVNFNGDNITLHSEVSNCITAAGIRGNNLVVNFNGTASGAGNILFEASNGSSGPGNDEAGIEAGGNLTINGDFGGTVSCVMDCRELASKRYASLYGFAASGDFIFNGDMAGDIFLAGYETSGSDAYGMRASKNLTVNGDISGIIMATAENSACGLYGGGYYGDGGNITASISGIIFAGKTTGKNDHDTLADKLRHFDENRDELLELSKGQYSVYTNGKSELSLTGQALLIGDLKVGDASKINIAGGASIYGDIMSSYYSTISVQMKLDNDSLKGTRLNMTSWNSNVTLAVDASDVTSNGTYSLGTASDLSAIKSISFSVKGSNFNLQPTKSVTIDGITYSLNNKRGNSVDTLSLTVSGIVFTDTVAPILAGQIAAAQTSDRRISLSWDAAGDDVGVAGYELAWNGETQVVNGTSLFVDNLKLGTYTFKYRAFDEAGNYSEWSDEQSIEFKDIEAPQIKRLVLTPSGLTNQDVAVAVEYEDDYGLDKIQYFIVDDGEWRDYTAPVPVSDNGVISFRAFDKSGNEADIYQFWIGNIDKEAPEAPTADVDTTENGNVDVVVIAGFTEDHAVRQYSFSSDSGWMDYTDGIVVTENGTVFFRGQDAAGNISETIQLQVFNIDRTMSVLPQVVALGEYDNTLTIKNANGGEFVFNLVNNRKIAIFGNTEDLTTMQIAPWGEKEAVTEVELISRMPKSVGESPVRMTLDVEDSAKAFFARANGVWDANYSAKHVDFGQTVPLDGKNAISDIFDGTDSTSILLLTDDVNGDALFLDDIYSLFPEGMDAQGRIAKINAIVAGAGDDLIDLTSQRFAYVGGGMAVHGGLGNDVIWANNVGENYLWANQGYNWLFGDAGNDWIIGGSDRDVIVGGSGDDILHGGGGEDVFCFGGNWGNDTVEQLAIGKVTLWFQEGDESKWDKSTLSYTDGDNSVQVKGVNATEVSLKFGYGDADPTLAFLEGEVQYGYLEGHGAFEDFTSEKIFDDRNRGMLA